MRRRRRTARPAVLTGITLAAALAVAAVALAAVLTGSSGDSGPTTPTATGTSGFDGAALPADTPAPPFTLTDQEGRAVSPASYRGRVTVLAFLYSGCAPACVLVAQQIRGALDELPRAVPVLIVTVDPSADTRARVRRFLRAVSLTGRVRYLTGPLPELERVWRAYRIVTPRSGRTAFERAATVLLIDRAGHRRVVFQQEQLTPESLAHDIGKLEGD